MLGFTRPPLLAHGSVDRQPVLQQRALLLRRSLRNNTALAIDLHPTARWIEAEPVPLEAAMLNLVLSEQDAIAHARAIRITGRPVVEHGPTMAALEHSDTGAGRDEPKIVRVFRPLFTTKLVAVTRGPGLGLAMVNAFATALGGHVTARNQARQDSVLALTLPAAAPGEPGQVWRNGAPAEVCPPCTVPLVEDDELVRSTTIAMLQSLGHQVQACADAAADAAAVCGWVAALTSAQHWPSRLKAITVSIAWWPTAATMAWAVSSTAVGPL